MGKKNICTNIIGGSRVFRGFKKGVASAKRLGATDLEHDVETFF